jgi:phosphate transport system substrate-binding protein
MRVILTNQPGDKAWPITGASFILMHLKQDKPENAKEVLKFYDWAFKNGKQMAESLDYVPMPESVVQTIHASWKQITDGSGKPVL